MKELIKQISQSLVDNADKVEVTEVIGDQSYIIELRVAKEDIGKVIGKHGRTAQAIRTILSAASAKAHKRVVLDILD
ncbi:MAG: RNA-binding protein [Deltaproteobacteria bacterium HGW-Deltaproteobacteria-13]|nr:MAG: RNA-binding protein [Deltaproteobacteria bacterium HGW-Deltaproteobacteria-13]